MGFDCNPNHLNNLNKIVIQSSSTVLASKFTDRFTEGLERTLLSSLSAEQATIQLRVLQFFSFYRSTRLAMNAVDRTLRKTEFNFLQSRSVQSRP